MNFYNFSACYYKHLKKKIFIATGIKCVSVSVQRLHEKSTKIYFPVCIDFYFLVILVVTNLVGLRSSHNERRRNEISIYNKLFSRFPKHTVRIHRGILCKIFHNTHLVLYIKLSRVKTFEEIFPTCQFQYRLHYILCYSTLSFVFIFMGHL